MTDFSKSIESEKDVSQFINNNISTTVKISKEEFYEYKESEIPKKFKNMQDENEDNETFLKHLKEFNKKESNSPVIDVINDNYIQVG